MFTDHIQELPLFPLHTVLFPGQLLPLKVFEPRYHQLVKRVLEGSGLFGVILIRSGSEVGGPAIPFDVGVTAQIKRVDELKNDELELLTVGEKRFKLRSVDDSREYLTGSVDTWPWIYRNLEDATPVSTLQRSIRSYTEILTRLTGTSIEVDPMPEEPFNLCCLASIILKISNLEKQKLLSTEHLDTFINSCLRILDREINALRFVEGLPLEYFPTDYGKSKN